MLIFLSQTMMMASLGVILYIFARTLPRIDDTALDGISLKTTWLHKHIEALDEKIKIVSEKWLRRLNVTLLKLHVSVHKKLAKMKKESSVSKNGNHVFAPDWEETKKQELQAKE